MCVLHLYVLLVVDILLLVSFFSYNTVFDDAFPHARMLFYFCVIVFVVSVKMLIQCVSFPRIFNKSDFIPPADLFSHKTMFFSSTPVIFENPWLIVLTMHCCFASFIISSYCSNDVLWFIFTCAVNLMEISSFNLT